jgi:hypothetical protein
MMAMTRVGYSRGTWEPGSQEIIGLKQNIYWKSRFSCVIYKIIQGRIPQQYFCNWRRNEKKENYDHL